MPTADIVTRREEPPYEQVCCPLTEYEGEVYYSPQDIVVY